MQRTLLFLSIAILLALLAGCDTTTTPEPNPTENYVPLARGNEWDYVWDLPEDGDPMNWEVLGSEDGAWSVEFIWGGTTEQWLWRHTEGGEFQAKTQGDNYWRVNLKTPIEEGTIWFFTDDDGVVWECEIRHTDMSFDTPAGYFEDLVMVSVHEEDRVDNWDYIENYWFKEGVGVVRVAIDDDDRDTSANWQWLLNYYTLK
ncbi:hypothetical protein KAU45_08915 [bacterium]|nr:hypothetical protein [bacterium]